MAELDPQEPLPNLPLVGVDGGQSQTRVQQAGSPTVYELPGISRLEGDPDDTLVGLLHRAWTAHRLPVQARVVLGLTTLPAAAPARDRLATRIAGVTQARQVWLTDDRLTAHHAALGDRVGVSLIAGTGVACTALTGNGRVRFFDGHGYLLGDEGAGFWIGRAGLAAVLHHRDGYGPPTALAEAARQRFGDLAGLPEVVHAHPRAVDAIARFAVEVLAATDAGDAVATAVVDDAASRLVRTVTAAAAWLGQQVRCAATDPDTSAEPLDSIPVALGGRLLGGGALRRRLEVALAAPAPGGADHLTVVAASGTPLDGALRLGAGLRPVPHGDLVHVWSAGERG